jgi:DNA-binding NarL/FixJ family response regulator
LKAFRDSSQTLTVRQREVLQLLAEGRSMKEAAAALDVTPRTIAFHKYGIMKRLGLETNADLVKYAIKHGIVATT